MLTIAVLPLRLEGLLNVKLEYDFCLSIIYRVAGFICTFLLLHCLLFFPNSAVVSFGS